MEAMEQDRAAGEPEPSRGFSARGRLLGAAIDARQGSWERREGRIPVVRAGRSGKAAILRYGAVVLFGVTAEEEAHFLADMAPRVSEPLEVPIREELHIDVASGGKEGISEDGTLLLDEDDDDRLRVVADVIGKSLVLEEHEIRMGRIVDRVAPLAGELALHGRLSGSERSLRSRMGEALVARHRMLGVAGVRERPEVLWERSDLGDLFDRLSLEFEIQDRAAELDGKVEVVSDTARTILDMMHSKRSHWLEWAIVALIVAELLVSLQQAFWR